MEKERDVSTSGEEQGTGKLRVSRRGFLKGMGVSTAAAAMATAVVPSLEAETAPLVKGIREAVIVTEINGKKYRLAVKSHWTLLDVLRRELGLTGTKKTCDRSSCGACTVLMDGKTVYACSILAVEADQRKITTIEALSEGETPHPIQAAFIREDAYQCGFCTPGMIMSTKALLDSSPRASLADIKEALSGNICRCAAYPKITKAVLSLAQKA
jgi:aerobic-type carbon monoxide dehydrogenase small subunit (CoxS/CutS family)